MPKRKTYVSGFDMCMSMYFNPLNAELNPFCHLLALLEAHHILHVSGVRVNVTAVPNTGVKLVQVKYYHGVPKCLCFTALRLEMYKLNNILRQFAKRLTCILYMPFGMERTMLKVIMVEGNDHNEYKQFSYRCFWYQNPKHGLSTNRKPASVGTYHDN
jgi:hypothetical protein